MDDALFARRALGGGHPQQQRAASASKSPKGGGGARPSPSPSADDEDSPPKPKYEPTPEDLIEMMKLLRDSGLSDAEPPPDVPETLEGMMAKLHKQQQQQQRRTGATTNIALPTPTGAANAAATPAPPPPQNRIRSFVPSAWMVVKTCTTAPCGPPLPEEGPDTPRRFPFLPGRKVFVNVCSSPAVPAPAAWRVAAAGAGTATTTPTPPSSSSTSLPPTVEAALDRWTAEDDASSEALRFPLSCGPLRHGCDRKGDPCSVADVVFCPAIIRAAERHRPLRAFLVQLSLEWVAQKYGLELDLAGFRLPRMAYKGAAGERGVAGQTLALAAKDLVREVDGGGGSGVETGVEEAVAEAPEAAATQQAAETAAAATQAAAATTKPPPPKPPPPKPPQRQQPQPLPFAVSFEGSPAATAAVVRVELPAHAPSTAAANQDLLASRVRVDVAGAAGRVSVALLGAEGGGEEGAASAATATAATTSEILLPFSVSAARSAARLAPDGRSVAVRLPWVPVDRAIEELVAGAAAPAASSSASAPSSSAPAAAVALSAVVSELE